MATPGQKCGNNGDEGHQSSSPPAAASVGPPSPPRGCVQTQTQGSSSAAAGGSSNSPMVIVGGTQNQDGSPPPAAAAGGDVNPLAAAVGGGDAENQGDGPAGAGNNPDLPAGAVGGENAAVAAPRLGRRKRSFEEPYGSSLFGRATGVESSGGPIKAPDEYFCSNCLAFFGPKEEVIAHMREGQCRRVQCRKEFLMLMAGGDLQNYLNDVGAEEEVAAAPPEVVEAEEQEAENAERNAPEN